MGIIRIYFRKRKWQRRILSLLLTGIVGCGVGMLLYPWWADMKLIGQLGSPDEAARRRAIDVAEELARRKPPTLRRLIDALDTENDAQFLAIATVLRRLNLFDAPGHDPLWSDRLRCLLLEQEIRQVRKYPPPNPDAAKALADVRRQYVFNLVRIGRDSDYVRRAARAAAGDPHPAVRTEAAMLAAKLGDDETLKILIEDEDSDVAATAAMDADIAEEGIPHTPKRMALGQSEESLIRVLVAAGKKDHALTRAQVIAALDAARGLQSPCRKEVYEIVRNLWHPDRQTLLVRAARLLGEQAAVDAGQAEDAPSRQACIDLLRQAALFEMDAKDAEGKPFVQTTPWASAAAAVALWMLEPSAKILNLQPGASPADIVSLRADRTSAFFVHEAAANQTTLPGDYIAWRIGRSGKSEAFELGKTFLPGPPGPDHRLREFNPRVRETGALLLAFAAGNDEQKRFARERIEDRMTRETFDTRSAMQTALLILGDETVRPAVRTLLDDYAEPDNPMALTAYPRRRTLTALLASGDRTALDWMLLNVEVPLETVCSWLVGLGLDEVLAATTDLPVPETAATEEMRFRQARRMRHRYGIFREFVRVGLAR